jgi:Flp pilus assembly protein TadD
VPALLLNQKSAAGPAAALSLFRQASRLQSQNRKLEAARCYAQALQLQPDLSEAAFNLGVLFQAMDQLPQAISCYRRTLQLQPGYVPAWGNLGVALRDAGENSEAIASFRQALRLEPGSSSVLNNLGNALRSGFRLDEAITAFREALRREPANAGIYENLANALREAGRPAEAVVYLRKALRLQPDFAEAHWDLAFALLLQGDFARGLDEYEWRWQLADFPHREFAAPLWQGEDLADHTLLVHTEQGAGDAIQFVRFANTVAAMGGRVVLECPRSLAALFASVEGISAVVVRDDPLPDYDWHVPLLSLPHRLGTRLDSIPAAVPYLRSPSDRQVSLPPSVFEKRAPLKVGLAWQGNPKHKNDKQRSLPLALLEPLFALENVAFYSLQADVADLRGGAPSPGRLLDLSSLLGDYGDTAALLEQLDLVISVDTSVAHLAGALARPAWVLLPFAPDWRWLAEREDSPWYPTLRLFRQPAPGDWASVVETVRATLAVWAPMTRTNSPGRPEAPEFARQINTALTKVPAAPADNTFDRQAAGRL